MAPPLQPPPEAVALQNFPFDRVDPIQRIGKSEHSHCGSGSMILMAIATLSGSCSFQRMESMA